MKITVITAVFNSKNTIASSIDSVVMQTHREIEHIIVDGGSTDGTLDILSDYQNKISNFVSEPDNGIYDALNKGIRLSSGDIIGFLHADDIFSDSQVLSRVSEKFGDPKVDVVYGDLIYVNRDNPRRIIRYWKSGEFSISRLRYGWMPPHPTVYIRRSAYEKIGCFDTSYTIAADYDFLLRLLSDSRLNVAYIDNVLISMRVGGKSNRSLRNILIKSKEDYLALRANKIGGIFSLISKNLRKIPQFINRS